MNAAQSPVTSEGAAAAAMVPSRQHAHRATTDPATPARVPLLDVRDLHVQFQTRTGVARVLDGVSLHVDRGETLGIVGESGSGKSVLFLALLGILEANARITSGSARFGGFDLLGSSEAERSSVRGRELAMVFQNPRAALNPIRRVGQQIEDVLLRHTATPRHALQARAVDALRRVQIADPEARYHAYPFELSGGQCQRVMIAMALACEPALLIADEPTTGLDVTTQAAIMALIARIARENGMATILVTHDLGLAGEHCDRIAVMHAGHLVEMAPAAELFARPRHPYTARLLASTPYGALSIDALTSVPGQLPDLTRTDLPPCRFSERCDRVLPACAGPRVMQDAGEGHHVACHNPC